MSIKSEQETNIEILLATYNGEAHLEEQINSVLNQSYSNWILTIRDDGSNDRTLGIIKKYQAEYPHKIILLEDDNKNLGASQNFGQLLKFSKAEYTMFCDQDDVWLSNKIELTLNKMKQMEKDYGRDRPLLVHTDLQVVDEELNLTASSFWKYQNLYPERIHLNRLLVKNVVTGCTMMMNRSLRELSLPIPQAAIMHDWWIGLVASAFGQIGDIDVPTILYRQHGRNSIGAKAWNFNSLMKKLQDLNRVKKFYNTTTLQAKAYLEIYKPKLDTFNLNTVKVYCSLGEGNFFSKRLTLIKHGYLEINTLSNVGLFLVV